MSTIRITVNGHSYDVACEDGEEDHVRDLAAQLDKHVNRLADSVGQIGEARLLLLAGLTLADTLAGGSNPSGAQDPDSQKLAKKLNSLADRLEQVAERLNNP